MPKLTYNPVTGDFDYINKNSDFAISGLKDVYYSNATNGDSLVWNAALGKWSSQYVGGGTGAPDNASYVTISAEGGLSNETLAQNLAGAGISWDGSKFVLTSGSQYNSAYQYSSTAKSLFFPSALGHYYKGSGTILNKVYLSSQRVKDLFDHLLYVKSGTKWTDLTDGGATTLHKHSILDMDAGNWKVFYSDSIGDIIELDLGSAGTFFKSNGEAAPTWVSISYYPSTLGHYFTNSGSILTKVKNSSQRVKDLFDHTLYRASSISYADVAWSGAYQFYAISSLNKTQYSQYTSFSSNLHYYYNSGDKLYKAYKSASTGVFASAGHTHTTTDVAWSGAGGFYGYSANANIKFVKSGLSEINTLSDVDTKTTTPSRDQVLKWNGNAWVPAAYNATFVFSITSFSDGESTTQLIGTGVWKAQSAMSCTAAYDNGPPTTTWITVGYNTTTYSKSGTVGAMTGPLYTAGTNSTKAISYPAAKDYYVRFRLSAQAGTDTSTSTETAVTFRNYIYYGVLTKNKTITEADIESLTGTLSHGGTPAGSYSITAGAGQYIVYAYPASYSNIPSGSDYENDGGTGFIFNSVACAFSGHSYVSVTNSANYTENYKVYASNLPNLGSYTLTTTTSVASINYLYYGKTTSTSGFTEADIEGLVNKTTTNDNTQTWTAVVTGVGEYMLFAFPKRLGTVTFWVGGFEGGFQSPETVSVTNLNGWTEDYYVWRSTNSNLGSTVVVTT